MSTRKKKAGDESSEAVEEAQHESPKLTSSQLHKKLDQVAEVMERERDSGALKADQAHLVGGPITDAAISRLAAIVLPLGEAGLKALLNKLFPLSP